MATGTSPRLHVVRQLLRLLKTPRLPDQVLRKVKQPLPRYNACQLYLLQLTRQDNNVVPQLAANYLQLQEDLAHRARLYQLDTSTEQVLTPQEMSRRAAARAGLQLPKLDLYEHDDEDDKK